MSILNALAPYGITALPLIGSFTNNILFNIQKELKGWPKTLKKSSLTPPDWVFAPAWTCLYLSMGYASYLIYRDGVGEARNMALGLYAGQLALNWTWAPVYFKYHKLGLSVAIIYGMGLGIASCILKFKPINETAAYLMLPYLAWVSFASYLNTYIWLNNRNKQD